MEDRRLIDVLTKQQLYESVAVSRLNFEFKNNLYHLSEACAHIQTIDKNLNDTGIHADDIFTIQLFLSEKLAKLLDKESED